MMKKVIFWGAKGQAKVLRECLKYKGYKVVALFDNDQKVSSPFNNIPIYFGKKGMEGWLAEKEDNRQTCFLVAIGGDNGKERIEIQKYLESQGLISLIARHPTSFIAEDVKIGSGSQILAHASVCVETVIGRGCIINTGAIVDHECHIGDGVHICPGVRIAGCVDVGRYSMIGTGAIILPNIKIGKRAIVGSGAVVLKDVPPFTVVAGNPAKLLRHIEK